MLLGPGPSNVHPRVLDALAQPLLGHLDPEFLALADDTQALLRETFRTTNAVTFPVSGTGSAGMESCFVNLIEPGDRVLVCVNGVFGNRMADVAARSGAEVARVEAPWGRAMDPDAVLSAGRQFGPKIIAMVHAETSTGALTPIPPIAAAARACGALLVADTVTSLAGIPVEVDLWGVDACYSGTQKCLSCPPGLAPVSYSSTAIEAVRARKSRVASWYLDLTMLTRYWSDDRVYHHTAPISMIYALREALRLVQEEGLEARWARHALHHRALAAGLEAMELSLVVPGEERLPQLNAIAVPEGVEDAPVRRRLLEEFGIEIGAGLGVFQGKVWRVGLMGYSASRENVLALLEALGVILPAQGHRVEALAGVDAAEKLYRDAGA
ncbi:MAG: alanine--glyoxylate aminotransferase family protein [Deltaproteobacteria bacterium]|nr:alanine--glyoxylate aminotransferase family protein [Deltaproteobacteria bacterium]